MHSDSDNKNRKQVSQEIFKLNQSASVEGLAGI